MVMRTGNNGVTPAAYYSGGPGKSSRFSKSRKSAAIKMLTHGGKTASAKGTSAMMTANRQAKKKVDKVGIVMHEFKHGQLHSGSSDGPKVKSRAQAIAIGLSEQRKHDQGKG